MYRILHLLWGLIVTRIDGKVTIIPRKSSSGEVYHQLEFVLGELKGFFNCDGNGVPYEDLNTDSCKVWYHQYPHTGNNFVINAHLHIPYQLVELKLRLLQTPTHRLIDMFYTELVERQDSAAKAENSPLGTLDLIVAYLKDKEAVEVTVVQARSLPEVSKHRKQSLKMMLWYGIISMCNAGQSDPFVELSLVPDSVFSKTSHTHFRTSPQKRTLCPVFSTEFLMLVAHTLHLPLCLCFFCCRPTVPKSLSEESATLLAAVFQHDANELIGLSVVACKEIPHLLAHVTSLKSTSGPERKKVTLPLISVSKTPILNELEARWEIGDTEAIDFCKSKRKLLHKMDLRKPNFKWLSNLNS